MSRTILFFHTGKSTFGDKDVSTLAGLGEVHVFAFTAKSKASTPLLFLQQFIFLLRYGRKASLAVCQFAGYHSFLPVLWGKIMNRPTLIISGGTDCHSFPNIGYGNFNKKILRLFTSWSFQLASHISPKHQSLQLCEYRYDAQSPSKQGIKAFLPELKTPMTVIPNGYDAGYWTPMERTEREPNSFITVTGGMQFPFQSSLKGIDLILSIAPLFPSCTFTLVGVPASRIPNDLPAHVTLLPPCSTDELRMLFSRHAFYLQLSMAEGFPNALCEAMLCGCVPIGSAVFSIPEIIGGNGFILSMRDAHDLSSLMQQAVSEYDAAMGIKARQSIMDRFPSSRRQESLSVLCHSLMNA